MSRMWSKHLQCLLDVRVGRQLSVVVMVHKARVYMLSLRFLVSDGKVDDHGFVANRSTKLYLRVFL